MILIGLTSLLFPGLVAGGWMFLPEVADLGVWLGAGRGGGGEGGAGVVGVAVRGVAGADRTRHAVRHRVRVVLRPAVGGVLDTDVPLAELSALLVGVVAGEPHHALAVVLSVDGEAEGLVDVADLSGQVVVTLVCPHEPVQTFQPRAWRGGVGGGRGTVRVVTQLPVITQTESTIVTPVIPAVLALLVAAGGRVLTIVVTKIRGLQVSPLPPPPSTYLKS